jgi:hypothetical protein
MGLAPVTLGAQGLPSQGCRKRSAHPALRLLGARRLMNFS